MASAQGSPSNRAIASKQDPGTAAAASTVGGEKTAPASGESRPRTHSAHETGTAATGGGGLSSWAELQAQRNSRGLPKRTHVESSPQGRYLRFEEKLGSGQYKDVYRAYDTSEGIEVAWNAVNITLLPREEKKRIMNEVRLLQNLEHKNLVQFHGSWVNREKEQVIFVTEIVVNGSLKDFINKVEVIRWKVIKRWARQILRGLEYLHTRDIPIIHRDLKCDNIFINGHTGDIRIGDLGLSTSSTRTDKNMSVLGTPEFMAPELYDEAYNEKVDIYAFGMCMLEMITKERPYSECTNAAQIYKRVTAGILPSALWRVQLRTAVDFIRECLDFDASLRPSAAELLQHRFLEERNDDEDNMEVKLGPPLPEGEMLGAGPGGPGGRGVTGGGKQQLTMGGAADALLPDVTHPGMVSHTLNVEVSLPVDWTWGGAAARRDHPGMASPGFEVLMHVEVSLVVRGWTCGCRRCAAVEHGALGDGESRV
ncbi:kinase-like domain-containing protein [Tribonema minus]|uniref:non-specific serine/threonine protein kinase n=1 Tax=Tribonema minus TaxID=303371 RepID=A0A835YJM9_9STRA|nr:kinase-like domain-containing protein [Tribonema minus]